MPGVSTVKFLMKRGFDVIHPRYRGSWESGGKFLDVSPEQDVLDILDELPNGFISAWDEELIHVKPKKIVVMCSSFGGPAGLLASRDHRISKVVAFSPVVDWGADSPEEPFDQLKRFTKEGFGEGYRIPEGNLEKLRMGDFYNPWGHLEEIPGEKILIIHADDDMITIPGPTLEFAEVTKSKLIMLKKGGHFGTGKLREWRIWRKVKRFFKS
jgi:pimeloyl-ACP methyl ester carboxylesterase